MPEGLPVVRIELGTATERACVVTAWAGRKVRRLINYTLATKGRICHLCDEDGADSADHDPPRSELIRLGVPNPDAPEYLWPSHYRCNLRRNDRPISDSLRLELRVKRRRDVERATADLSPRFRRLTSV